MAQGLLKSMSGCDGRQVAMPGAMLLFLVRKRIVIPTIETLAVKFWSITSIPFAIVWTWGLALYSEYLR
jgi:hypothetical protein